MNRVEKLPVEQFLGTDTRALRNVLGQFATGIAVITAQTDCGTRAGITVSSFSALSLDPPLILWSLACSAGSIEIFRQTEFFAVNILAHEQKNIAEQFARPAPDKFAGVEIVSGIENVPLIAGATAHLECVVYRRDLAGDHELYIGEVKRAAHFDRAPLVCLRGGLGGFEASL